MAHPDETAESQHEPLSQKLSAVREQLPRANIAGSDLLWYGVSTAIALTGFVLQLASSDARSKGGAILILVLGLFLGLVRLVLQRLAALAQDVGDKIDALTAAADLTPSVLTNVAHMSPLAPKLWETEVARHQQRFDEYRDGILTVAGSERAVEWLAKLTEEAALTIHAVDHIEVARWLNSPRLQKYLALQLERVRSHQISLERIRFLHDAQMADETYLQDLSRFVRMHADAGASLLLCREADVRELGQSFFPSTGMLVIDRALAPAAIMARRIYAGDVETATVFFRKTSQLTTALTEYDEIRQRIELDDLDKAIREQLWPRRSRRGP